MVDEVDGMSGPSFDPVDGKRIDQPALGGDWRPATPPVRMSDAELLTEDVSDHAMAPCLRPHRHSDRHCSWHSRLRGFVFVEVGGPRRSFRCLLPHTEEVGPPKIAIDQGGRDRCTTSAAYADGRCALWINGDTLCDKPLGHPGVHRGHDPYGAGMWIECDDFGVETSRGGFSSLEHESIVRHKSLADDARAASRVSVEQAAAAKAAGEARALAAEARLDPPVPEVCVTCGLRAVAPGCEDHERRPYTVAELDALHAQIGLAPEWKASDRRSELLAAETGVSPATQRLLEAAVALEQGRLLDLGLGRRLAAALEVPLDGELLTGAAPGSSEKSPGIGAKLRAEAPPVRDVKADLAARVARGELPKDPWEARHDLANALGSMPGEVMGPWKSLLDQVRDLRRRDRERGTW